MFFSSKQLSVFKSEGESLIFFITDSYELADLKILKKKNFFHTSYLSHTEKSIRSLDPDDPEPKNPSGSDPKTNSMDPDEKSRVSV